MKRVLWSFGVSAASLGAFAAAAFALGACGAFGSAGDESATDADVNATADAAGDGSSSTSPDGGDGPSSTDDGGTSHDGSPPKGDAAAFCQNLPDTGVLFCDDFDQPGRTAIAGTTPIWFSDAGQEGELSDASFTSPPRSARFASAASDGAGRLAWADAVVQLTASSAATTLTIHARVRPEADVKEGRAVALYATAFALEYKPCAGKVDLFNATGSDPPYVYANTAFGPPVPTGVWSTVAISLSGDASKVTVTLDVDGDGGSVQVTGTGAANDGIVQLVIGNKAVGDLSDVSIDDVWVELN